MGGKWDAGRERRGDAATWTLAVRGSSFAESLLHLVNLVNHVYP
jgi:hypothetical protein